MESTFCGKIEPTKYANAPGSGGTLRGLATRKVLVMHDHSIPPPTEEQMKTCSRCGEVKLVTEFFRVSSKRDTLRSHCKTCHGRSQAPEDALTVRAKGLRKRHRSSVSVPALRKSLGEPTHCYLCGMALTWDTAAIDHVIPVAKGGRPDASNLRWAHKSCNAIKTDMTIPELVKFARRFLAIHDKSEVEAARAYDKAAHEALGDKATLNFPDEVQP